MTPLHTRLFGLLSVSWGGLLVYFYYSTRVKIYLDIGFHHFIMIGGLGMIVLGLHSLICPGEAKAGHDHPSRSHDHNEHNHHAHGATCHHHEHHHEEGACDHHHDEGHGPFITILLTVIPLTVAMTYSEDSLSNTGLSKKGLYESPNLTFQSEDLPPFTREDLEKNYTKNASGEFQLSLISAYYAAGDREIQGIFEGLPVEFEGRIAPEKVNNESEKRLRIFRKIITCCAADLQVVGVSLEFPKEAPRPAIDAWVRAGGTLTFENVNGNVVPLLKIREVAPAEEPYSEFLRRQ